MLSPGYDYGYVCVEFSLLEDAIGCMEANQVALYFGQMMLEGYIFMYGREGFKRFNFGKVPEICIWSIPHSNQKAVVRKTLKEAGKVPLEELMGTEGI